MHMNCYLMSSRNLLQGAKFVRLMLLIPIVVSQGVLIYCSMNFNIRILVSHSIPGAECTTDKYGSKYIRLFCHLKPIPS